MGDIHGRCSHHHSSTLPRGLGHPEAAEEEQEGGEDGRQESERGVDAAAAAEEPQQRDRLKAHHQVKHRLQNHQQASRLDEQLFAIKLIIILINLINSRLKIIINIVVSKRTISIVRNIMFLSSLKRCTK